MYIYAAAKQRCTNPKNNSYKNYGGRGIEMRFKSCRELLDEIGHRPSPELSLDRINNDGHYEKGNVRWATILVQANNRRKCEKRVTDGHEDEIAEMHYEFDMSHRQIAKVLGIGKSTIGAWLSLR